MMFNIKTGYGGITKRENPEIVIFISSIHRLQELALPFVVTNQHACSVATEFYGSIDHLDRIDWQLLRQHDFKTTDTDPGRQVRYQAEALVHQYIPLHALHGIACYTHDVRQSLESQLKERNLDLPVGTRPTFYF